MKKILVLSLLALIASCSDFKTHGRFITEHRDAWIDGFGPGGEPYFQDIDIKSKADKGLLFCRANVKEDGSADPVCFVPRFGASAASSVEFKKK
jgi:hypothetical protein